VTSRGAAEAPAETPAADGSHASASETVAHPARAATGTAARDYSARGWRVLPLHGILRGRCTCRRPCGPSAGKHPIADAVPRGVHDATTDLDILARCWSRWPAANIGIATGQGSGLLVVDIDPRSGGDETFARLERQLGALPETPRVSTGGDGVHYYFRWPAGEMRSTFGRGIDVKHTGGYVVAPPSRHASGRVYAWCAEAAPDEVALAELPNPWLAAVRRPAVAVATTAPDRVCHVPVADRVRRARAYVAQMPPAIAGNGGHAALWAVAVVVVRGFSLDPQDALPILVDYSARCLPPWSERDVAHKIEDAMQRSTAPDGWLLGRGSELSHGS